jgi:transposase
MRYEITDHEWAVIRPMLPNKARGVRRVDDRRVLNGIFWMLRSGAPWRDLPQRFGPYTTCYNRFVRWRRAGVWAKIMSAFASAHDAAVQMIDTSIVRVHQHGACIFDLSLPASCLKGATSKNPIVFVTTCGAARGIPRQATRMLCSHSITSSARASSVGGTARPSALAVLKLMANSNLVGCNTGRLAGFSPLRMRPTYVPAS